MLRALQIILATAVFSLAAWATAAETNSAPHAVYLKAKPEIIDQWQDMRFGMFICWGPVALTGQEIGFARGAKRWGHISDGKPDRGMGPVPGDVYDNLYKTWKPDEFDAREWARIAKEGGMKYIIFLVKHHDGFCLYDTKLTDYKSTSPEAAWKHDVLKDVADACHEAGIKLIVYYSPADWHQPDYFRGVNAETRTFPDTAAHHHYIDYFHGQIREILTNYGKIDGLWFDGAGRPIELWQSEKLFAMARQLQPWLILNNRCVLEGDYYTPEQSVGMFNVARPWESCMTMGTQWSWKPNDTLKSADECIRVLASCACGGGNYALNTGPMPDGQIEPRQAEIYLKIGAWMKKNDESIYGTRGGPFHAPDTRNRQHTADYKGLPGGDFWGGSTHKGNVIYLHILRWPAETVWLPPINHKIMKAALLGGGQATVKQTEQGISVSVRPERRDQIDTIVKLELGGPAKDIPPVLTGAQQ